jgi:membrane associated rhomboid family serine protease
MLLIPIAQEDSTVRRLPWVSIVLIALCFVTFLGVEIGSDADAQWEGSFSAFLDFLGQHPYLSPPPEILNLLKEGFAEALETARAEWERQGGTVDPLTAESQQAQLNALAQEAIQALHATPGFRFGFVPAAPQLPNIVTSLFMHAGWLHLLGNMLFLFLTGPFIEDRYGRPLFAGLYLLSGVAALGAHVVNDPASPVPLVGASGAIAGVMGAFLVRLGANRIRFLFFPLPPLFMLRTQLVLPAFVVLPLWLLEQVWYARVSPQAGVAWWAHIGGFAFGLLAALALKLFSVEESWVHPAIEKEIGITQNPGLERAQEARLAGDLVRARRELQAVLRAEPENVDAWREAYEGAVESGDAAETGRAGERLLGLLQRQKEDDLANELAYDPRWRELPGLSPRLWMAAAACLERAGDARAALESYAAVVERSPRDPAALRALVRRAEILKQGGDRKRAREALEQARAHPSCQDPWPALIEKGLRELG